jgi:hypothetical protein
MLTSNLAFSDWPKVFAGDEKLTTALADRATVISSKGTNFRMRRRDQNEPEEKAPPLAPAHDDSDQKLNKAKQCRRFTRGGSVSARRNHVGRRRSRSQRRAQGADTALGQHRLHHSRTSGTRARAIITLAGGRRPEFRARRCSSPEGS